MNISLEKLPNVSFAEKDVETIKRELIADFEEVAGRTLYPSDPLRLLLLTFADIFVLQRNIIDYSAKQNLLKYSGENYIENLGAFVGVSRLEACPAVVSLKFIFSIECEEAIIIPKGTRVSGGENIYFATVEQCVVLKGEKEIVVKAECTQFGEVGNGFYPGQINKIVDNFGYLCEVCNITISAGGSDEEDIENFRERILMSPESFSTAGPTGAYEYWAKTAHQDISDVSVFSPSAGVVKIIVLGKNGDMPSDEILNSVYNVCSDDNRRPLTDNVDVAAPEKIKYDIEFTYYISNSDSAAGNTIQKSVKSAVDEYILWQKERLGRDINPSELIKTIMSVGVKRVDVVKPCFQNVNLNQIAFAENINIVYGGLEDD